MKTVLCYGDSNTYGFNPLNAMRYPENVRWTGRLAALLGEEYRVIEEGCNGRTTVFDDPVDGWKNGLSYLKPCLNSYKPIDIVIMMLGSNDLKNVFAASAETISKGAERLVEEIYDFADTKQSYRPVVIVVSPPEVGPGICSSPFSYAFDKTAVSRSKEFSGYYREMAERNGCIFFNAAEYVKASEADSLHLMPPEHEKLARELYKCIMEIESPDSRE